MRSLIISLLIGLCLACGKIDSKKVSAGLSSAFAEEEIKEIPPLPFNIYLVIDGSGSGQSYAIPKLSTSSLVSLIEKMSASGGGHLYLNAIDLEADNNLLLHYHVPSLPLKPSKRAKHVGEQSYQYQKIEKEYEIAIKDYEEKYQQVLNQLESFKAEQLPRWESYIEQTYIRKSNAEDYSDVLGVINSAYRSLASHGNNFNTYIVALSDLENDVPQKPKTLSTKPKGVKTIRINATDSGKPSVPIDIETDNFENVMEHIFNTKINF